MKALSTLLIVIILSATNVLAQLAQIDISSKGKFYFSNQPFTSNHEGSKTSFTSNEFIYGRVELTGGTVKEVFKIPAVKKDRPYPFLRYILTVYQGNEKKSHNFWECFLLKDEDINNTWLNFDILPEPSKATSLICASSDFSPSYAAGPFYHLLNKDNFPENGKYTIHLEMYEETMDAWGNREDAKNWVFMKEQFDFTFNTADIATMIKNGKTANAVISENAFKYSKLPDVFANPGKYNDPKVTNAKIAAILKRDLPERQILKFVIENASGSLWGIDKNNDGTIRQRYFTPNIYVAYKKDGKCYIGTLYLKEQYMGGGKYGTLQVGSTSASNSGGDRQIDCGKVK